MVNQSITIFENFEKPNKSGMYHRLLCMTGEKKGTSYYLNLERVLLGRGDDVDIQVMDSKSSREHAELKKIGENYVLTDLDSQNGLIVNDLKIIQHILVDGDKIIIGKTVYKYNLVHVEKDDGELPILREKVESLKIQKIAGEKTTEKKKNVENKKNKLPIIIAILGLGVFFILDDTSTDQSVKKESITDRVESKLSRDFSDGLLRKKKERDKITEEKLSVLIHRGLREYREKNYFRAIKQFELALVLSPTNERSLFYLNKTRKSLDDEIEGLFLKANQDLNALKYRSALISYCSIMRLLQGYPNDERYRDAEGALRMLERKMGLDEGGVQCVLKEWRRKGRNEKNKFQGLIVES